MAKDDLRTNTLFTPAPLAGTGVLLLLVTMTKSTNNHCIKGKSEGGKITTIKGGRQTMTMTFKF
jgi:hypothetical protein